MSNPFDYLLSLRTIGIARHIKVNYLSIRQPSQTTFVASYRAFGLVGLEKGKQLDSVYDLIREVSRSYGYYPTFSINGNYLTFTLSIL